MFDIRSTEQFDFCDDAYASLFEKSNATAFQNPVWLDAHYRHVVPEFGGVTHIIQIFHRPSGALVGLVPLVMRRIKGVRILEYADQGVCDYAAPIIDPDFLPLMATSEVTCAALRKALGNYDHFRLKSIRQDTANLWHMFGVRQQQTTDFSAHAATMSAPYSEWRIQAFSKSHAKYIDRRRRRAERETTVEIARIEDTHSAVEAIRHLASLRQGRFDNDPIQRPGVSQFYQQVAGRGSENGFAEIWSLRFDGELACVVFGITDQDKFHYLLIGADYENFGRHSPGLLMYDAMMEDWCNRGGAQFDFTIGDEGFKADFGTTPIDITSFADNATLTGLVATRGMQLANAARPHLNSLLKISGK